VERLAGGDALSRVLWRLCQEWLIAQRERLGARTPCVMLHDPLTLASLVAPDLCRFESRQIRIDDRGRTTCGAGAMVEAAVDLDVTGSRSDIMETLLSAPAQPGSG
jgi:inosine-uridine nucleoside N-ribohydrolase